MRVKNDRIYNKVPPVKSLNTTKYAATHDTARPVVPLRGELGRPRGEVRAFIPNNLGSDELAGFGTPGTLRPRAG